MPKLDRRLRGPLVVAKKPAKTVTTLDLAAAVEANSTAIDQSIAEPLVIPLAVVVLDLLLDHTPKMSFPQRNHSGHAL